MANAEKLLEQAKQHLEPGELVKASVMGAYETRIMGNDSARGGILIATDRRVVFYAKKLGGFDLESFPFGNISSFEHGKSMMGHHIAFHASGNKVQVKWLTPPNDFAAFLDVVKSAMNAKHVVQAGPDSVQPEVLTGPLAPPASSASNVLATLKQLGELRDGGVVTIEEFEAKKAELLGRI